MSKRTVSAHAYPEESKEAVIQAVQKGRAFDVIVTDPLVLGTGAFDIQEIGDDVILKVTDATRRGWMVFIEREGGRLVLSTQ